jgi:hypothetical protein
MSRFETPAQQMSVRSDQYESPASFSIPPVLQYEVVNRTVPVRAKDVPYIDQALANGAATMLREGAPFIEDGAEAIAPDTAGLAENDIVNVPIKGTFLRPGGLHHVFSQIDIILDRPGATEQSLDDAGIRLLDEVA